MTKHLVSIHDDSAISIQTATILRATVDLYTTLRRDLPGSDLAVLMATTGGGGRIGLEVTIDRNEKQHISIIAVEPEGRHQTIATILVKEVHETKIAK